MILGVGSSTSLRAGFLRAAKDTLITSTPARFAVGEGPVHITLRALPGEPWLHALVSRDGAGPQVESWGGVLELRREADEAGLRIAAPTLRTAR
jgi:hypothetical protein